MVWGWGKVRIRRRGRNCRLFWVDHHLLALSVRHILIVSISRLDRQKNCDGRDLGVLPCSMNGERRSNDVWSISTVRKGQDGPEERGRKGVKRGEAF